MLQLLDDHTTVFQVEVYTPGQSGENKIDRITPLHYGAPGTRLPSNR